MILISSELQNSCCKTYTCTCTFIAHYTTVYKLYTLRWTLNFRKYAR